MEILATLLVILLVLMLVGALATGKRGYAPAGLIGLVTLILFIILFFAYV